VKISEISGKHIYRFRRTPLIMNSKWLDWAKEIQAISQAGLTFTENQYDIDRYNRLRELSVEIMSEYSGVNNEKVRDLFANETGYQTPKVDIRSAVFKDGKVLMVKEKIDGKWSLPGGWADVNATVRQSAIKECSEEAGAIVEPRRIIAVHYANRQNELKSPFSIYKIFVECTLIDEQFAENTETLESGFFALDSLPELSTNRNTFDQVKTCFESRNKQFVEPQFD